MNVIIYRLILFLGIAFASTSCRKLVQDEFATPDLVPVANAVLIQGQPLEINLSYTANIGSSEIEVIDNCDISLFINNKYVEDLLYKEGGIYQSQINIDEGTIYKCDIFIPGHKTITCFDSIPKNPKVYEIKHINEAGKNEEGTTYPAIKITFGNDTSKVQYFEISIIFFSNGEANTATLEKITDPLIINEGLPIALFSNHLIADTSYQLTLNYTTGSQSFTDGKWHTDLYPLIVELRSISYNYYQYAKSLYLYEEGYSSDGLSAGTNNFNTYSNIEEAYGIFAGFSVYQSDTIFPNSVENE